MKKLTNEELSNVSGSDRGTLGGIGRRKAAKVADRGTLGGIGRKAVKVADRGTLGGIGKA